MKNGLLKINITTLVLVAVFLPTNFAKADSVMWNQTVALTFEVSRPDNSVYKRLQTVRNPNFQVKYNARVLNVDTGQVLSCGSKVAPGTKVRFEFIPHEYTDVAWFGTGTRYDSPYGSWNLNAERSAGSICQEKNFYLVNKINDEEEVAAGARIRINNYIDFSVNPPTKTIYGLNDVAGCQTLNNGNVECDVDEEKTLSAQFNFAETFGQMYYGFKRLKDVANPVDKCYLSQNPLYIPSINSNVSLNIARIIVPTHTIPCTINVADSNTNTPPNAPSISVKNNTDNSCISGATISYNVTAVDRDTDPEDSQIRYLIDWDSDGSADQIVPSTGYLQSNTTQTFNFVTRDDEEQTFKVATQDKGGLMSSWVSFRAARCVNEELIIDPNLTDTSTVDTSIYGPGEVEFSLNPSITNTTCRATWSSENVSTCSLYKNGGLLQEVEVSGQLDLTPGRYELRCRELRGGGTITVSKEQTCFLNPDFREL
ncbi:MAG: hypothetical protein WC087_01310 [Candidatus Paceibacterota bacterium]